MRTYDLSPLFRSSVGFDRLSRLIEASQATEAVTYPPYNIEKLDENSYRITVAVAGFGEGEIDITVENNALTVKGKSQTETEGTQFLHRGIAARQFQRVFLLAEGMKVAGADLLDGLLTVDLVRPEQARLVKKIDIMMRD